MFNKWAIQRLLILRMITTASVRKCRLNEEIKESNAFNHFRRKLGSHLELAEDKEAVVGVIVIISINERSALQNCKSV